MDTGIEATLEQLLKRAFLFEDPEAYAAGVRDAAEALSALLARQRGAA